MIVVFKMIPPQQEQVGGTIPGLDMTKEGVIKHHQPNDSVVVVVTIDLGVSTKADSKAAVGVSQY